MVFAETVSAERYVVYKKDQILDISRDFGGIIEFSIETGILTFLPSPFYNTLCVTVESEETGEMWCGVVTSDNLSMSFTGESGIYTLTCITEDGTEYTSTFIQ